MNDKPCGLCVQCIDGHRCEHLPPRASRDLISTSPPLLATPGEVEQLRRTIAEQDVTVAELRARLAGAEAANAEAGAALVEHTELNGHVEIAEQCLNYLVEAADDDLSGKLDDFVKSLRVVIDQLDRQRRQRNWYEVGYTAGKQKLIESAVAKAFARARAAAQAYAHCVNQLGLAADDNDPKVMATAEPIGAAQADLYDALGIEGYPPCGFGPDGGDCPACSRASELDARTAPEAG